MRTEPAPEDLEKLVETMARSLCVRNGQYECMMGEPPCTVDTCGGWEGFVEDARAALSAMREAGYVIRGGN